MAVPTTQVVNAFKGLNNRIDPIRLGLEWQLQADNVLCDDAGYLVRRPGLSAFTGTGIKDVHGTRDGRLLIIDASDRLVQINEAGEYTVLHTGVTGAPFQWAELGYAIFLMSNTACWAVYPGQVMTWGVLCPTTPADSYPISYPPPLGNLIGVRRDQIAIAVWENNLDRSVLYFSRPGYPHEFRLERDYQLFAGRITLLADTSFAFIIATDRAIYLDSYETSLARVADYGVPLNGMVYDERDVVFFWSERGLCKAAPFENLTDKQLAITERTTVTATLLDYQGSRYAVVQQTGVITTRRGTQPYIPIALSIIVYAPGAVQFSAWTATGTIV